MSDLQASPNQRCTICGLVVAGDQPPAHCPECGALGAMFAATSEPPHGIPHNPFQRRGSERGEVLGPGETGCVDSD